EGAAEKTQNDAFAKDNFVRALDADISRQKDRLGHLAERFDASRIEQAALRAQAEALEAEGREIGKTLMELESQEAKEAEIARLEHERLETRRAEGRAADTILTEVRTRAAAAASGVAAARAKLAGLARRGDEMRAQRTRLGETAIALGAQREELDRHEGGLA